MIPNHEVFTLREDKKDSLGKILKSEDKRFWGVSDEDTVYSQDAGSLTVLGKGTIFSSDIEITPAIGSAILVDSEKYTVNKVFRAKVLGVFHHWEIVYG